MNEIICIHHPLQVFVKHVLVVWWWPLFCIAASDTIIVPVRIHIIYYAHIIDWLYVVCVSSSSGIDFSLDREWPILAVARRQALRSLPDTCLGAHWGWGLGVHWRWGLGAYSNTCMCACTLSIHPMAIFQCLDKSHIYLTVIVSL